MAEPTRATSWSALSELYDGFIFDQFGVLHNGAEALPGAPELIAQLAAGGKRLGLLSNSSRRKDWTLCELPKFGFDASVFATDAVTTSGEEAWHALRKDWSGESCVWISKEDGADYLDGTGVGLSNVETAAFVLASGTSAIRDGRSVTHVDTEQTGDLAPMEALLARAVERHLPMVCANPDLISPAKPGKRSTHQPGLLAARYEALGGRVLYYGKPHAHHFAACVAGLGLQRERVAHVGDSMQHDVVGANAAGVPVIFVAGGIEHERLGITPGHIPPPASLEQLFAAYGAVPTHTVALARWDSQHVLS